MRAWYGTWRRGDQASNGDDGITITIMDLGQAISDLLSYTREDQISRSRGVGGIVVVAAALDVGYMSVPCQETVEQEQLWVLGTLKESV